MTKTKTDLPARSQSSRAQDIYVDISELYDLGRRNREVTGVSRVVLEVAYELSKTRTATLVIADAFSRKILSVDPSALEARNLYDRHGLLRSLGKPRKYRDADRYPSGSIRRFKALFANAVSRVLGFFVSRHGTAVGSEVDLADCQILCLGLMSTNRRTVEIARASSEGANCTVLIHDVMMLLSEHKKSARAEYQSLEVCSKHGVQWVANSDFTKREVERLVENSKAPPSLGPIETVLLGHEMRNFDGVENLSAGRGGPYLLTVGSLDGRKNGSLLFDAMLEIFRRRGPSAVPNIVAAGKHNPKGIRGAFNEGGKFETLKPFVEWVDQPEHVTLYGLYENAAALIYPSRYEGFGLPVGEALWLGTPVLASNAASIPEVGGNLVQYFEPDDAAQLASLMERVMLDHSFTNSWRTEIRERKTSLRDWSTVAADFVVSAGQSHLLSGDP